MEKTDWPVTWVKKKSKKKKTTAEKNLEKEATTEDKEGYQKTRQ